jgi:uncharacterized protein YerC
MVAMRAKGATYRKIGDEVGMSFKSVQRVLDRVSREPSKAGRAKAKK